METVSRKLQELPGSIWFNFQFSVFHYRYLIIGISLSVQYLIIGISLLVFPDLAKIELHHVVYNLMNELKLHGCT